MGLFEIIISIQEKYGAEEMCIRDRVITVVPLTSRIYKKRYLPTHVFISKYDMTGIRKGSLALAEQYIKVGREISGRSKIRLIVPHSEGQSDASASVYPCYYEITYQLAR